MKTTRRALGGAALAATLLLAGCGGGGDGDATETVAAETDGGTEAEAESASPTMPDVIGKPVDEATAELEEAGFVVSTGIVRTTEMDPDLVYRSEPAPGLQVKEGQRVTLRVAAEPRE